MKVVREDMVRCRLLHEIKDTHDGAHYTDVVSRSSLPGALIMHSQKTSVIASYGLL